MVAPSIFPMMLSCREKYQVAIERMIRRGMSRIKKSSLTEMPFLSVNPTNPNTSPVLVMFDPITLPSARSVVLQLIPSTHCRVLGSRNVAMILETHSGRDVPKATSVNPMIISEMPTRLAISAAPSMKKSEPLIRSANPMSTKPIEMRRGDIETPGRCDIGHLRLDRADRRAA